MLIVYYFPDGSNSVSFVPLAGLLTGVLLTLGMAVLVVVVIAVRRKRECDGRLHCPHHLNLGMFYFFDIIELFTHRNFHDQGKTRF